MKPNLRKTAILKALWLGLVIGVTAPSRAATTVENCAKILKAHSISDVFSPQESFRIALARHLESLLKKKQTIPLLDKPIAETSHPADAAFVKMAKDLTVEVNWGIGGTIDWEDAGADTEDVFTFVYQGATWYFRPVKGGFNEGKQSRKSLAASLLNEALGLSTVPKVRWAQVNDELGSLSECAVGEPVSRFTTIEKFLNDASRANPEALNCAAAFEFLVGNKDVTYRNFTYEKTTGRIQVFDHDNAFVAGLVAVSGPNSEGPVVLGTNLPEQYTADFVAKLKSLNATKLGRLVGQLLSKEEMNGILFRRAILLEDIKIRKNISSK